MTKIMLVTFFPMEPWCGVVVADVFFCAFLGLRLNFFLVTTSLSVHCTMFTNLSHCDHLQLHNLQQWILNHSARISLMLAGATVLL